MTTIQRLTRSIMQEFDVTQGGHCFYEEFADFIDGFAETMTGHQPPAATSPCATLQGPATPVPTNLPAGRAADLMNRGDRQAPS